MKISVLSKFSSNFLLIKREFEEKKIEKTARICYNESNDKLKEQKGVFFYETDSNIL